MNKQCFRVIFSKTLQRLVVVSELAKSEGKSTEQSSFSLSQIFAKMRPLTFSLFCALGFVAFSDNVLAETLIIQADKTAPKNQQPIVLQTANGLPQVNIQTPNDKGLSHNKYNQFSVDTKGAVLNNSRTNTQTQQGGWVQGNPYLARGEAKVILNEVTSNNPSVLKGYVEVAGKKADVIIANPNGIHCAGCGVINSDRATLTTGKPQVKNGHLDSFVVEKGKVSVSGKGLDNSRVDYTEILAREAEVNAGIWSKKETKVVTGKNTIKRSNNTEELQIIHTNQPLAGENQPKFAVDVGELGGMYSGKIHLIGTENGIGVRNAGHIGASSETLKIDSQGRIVNRGTFNAQKEVQLAGTKGIENHGKLETNQGNIVLTSQADIQQHGSIVARQGNIQQRAVNGIRQSGETIAKGKISFDANRVEASESSLIAAGVEIQQTAQGEARQLSPQTDNGKDIQISTRQQAVLNGKNIASGTLQIKADKADLNKSQTSANRIDVHAKTGDIQANQAKLSAKETLRLNTPKTLSTEGSHVSATHIQTTQTDLNTRNAVWEQTGEQDFALKAQTINNQGGAIKTQGKFTIRAEQLDNTKGRLVSNAEMDIKTQALNNKLGYLVSNQPQTVNSQQLTNQQGVIASQNSSVDLSVSSLLNNQQGTISAKNQLNLTAYGVDNKQGTLYTAQDNLVLDTQKQALNNQQGQILSGKASQIDSAEINNQQGTLFSTENQQINTNGQQLTNTQDGKIQSLAQLIINTVLLDNQGGFIQTQQGGTITASHILNNKVTENGSLIEAGAPLVVNTPTFENNGTVAQDKTPTQGIIAQKLTLTSDRLENEKGGIYVENDGLLNIAKVVNNQAGEILGWGDLVVLGYRTDLMVANKGGKIQAEQRLSVDAKAISEDGHLEAKDLSIKQKDDFNTKNNINAKSTLAIETLGNVVNNHKLSASDKLALTAQSLNNAADGRISSGHTRITVNDKVENRGLINSFNEDDTSKTVVKAKVIENKGSGRIYGDYVALGAENILNQDESGKAATIAARKRLDLASKTITNEMATYDQNLKGGGYIYSGGDIVFGSELNDQDLAEGQADSFKNISSVIEAVGHTVLNIKNIENINKYYRSELQIVGPINEVDKNYILPEGEATKVDQPYNNGKLPYISTDELQRIGFSRTWKWMRKYNVNNLEVITDTDQIKSKVLASPNQVNCDDNQNCKSLDAGVYKKDSPVWGYFGIEAPTEDVPEITPEMAAYLKRLELNDEKLSSLSDEELVKLDQQEENQTLPVIPLLPIQPAKQANESEEVFQTKLENYRKEKEAYDKAVQAKKDYELMKPLQEWTNKYGDKLKALTEAIDTHNKEIVGDVYDRFWAINVKKEYVKENVTTRTAPAQILSGEGITYNSERFLNDKSWVIAKGIEQVGIGKLENRDDEDAIHQDIEEGNRHFSYTVWRGGHRRYFQRKDNSHGPLMRINETHKDMGIWQERNDITPSEFNGYVNSVDANGISSQGNELALKPLQEDVPKFKELTISAIPTPQDGIEIRSVKADTRLPNQSLYKINPDADSHVLIETDPDFTDRKRWLASDYMYNALRSEHEAVHKRLGDGFYEQRLVREQINKLTGRQFLGEFENFEAQYKALMDAGITFAQKFNLRPGISLSSNQVAQLTSDIVWLETESVTLPNGQVVQVLVPKVYAVARKGDISGKGTLISADKVNVNTTSLINEGTIAGRNFVKFAADKLVNSGKISGGILQGKVSGDAENNGGVMEANSALFLDVAGNFTHSSTTRDTEIDLDGFKRKQTTLDRKALLHVKDANGTLQVTANNVTLNGSDIINDGQGLTYLKAKDQMHLGTVAVGFDEKMGGGNHYRNEAVQDVVVSRVSGNGNVTLVAKDLYAEGGDFEAKQRLVAYAENNLVLDSATLSGSYEEYHRTKSSGAFGSSKKTTRDTNQYRDKEGVRLGGDEIIVSAGNDVTARNLQAIADKDVLIQGGNNVTLTADTNYFKETHFEKKSKSGAFGGGGLGITFGKKSETHETKAEGWQQSEARSTLGSLSGNITVSAGNHAHISGTDMVASKELGKQILVEGDSTYVGASEDELSSKERHEYKQSGLTLALSSAVTDAAMSAKSSLKRSNQVKDERLGALLKVKAANEALETVRKAKDLIDTIQNVTNATQAASNPDIKISVSVGASKSVSTSHTQQKTHQGSSLSAHQVTIRAKNGDNTVEGSKLDAVKAELEGNNVNLLSTTDSQRNRSDNKNSSWSVGVFAGKSGGASGFGVEGAANVGKGHSNSESEVRNNTEINAEHLTINAKEKTTLKGAVANVDHLTLNTKDLHVESEQDIEKYDSKQTQGGVSASVAIYGSGSSVSAQMSQNKAKVDYAQVNQQSGFNIGKTSEINVEENTHLAGGVINAEGDKANHRMKTGTLSTAEIENRSDIKVTSVSAGASSDMGQMAGHAMGAALSALGNMSESERSTTSSAISDNIDLQITDSDKQKALTGKTAEEALQILNRDVENANGKVEKQDLTKLQERQEMAQVIGELSQSAINYLVEDHLEEADKKRAEAERIAKTDPAKAEVLRNEAKAIEAEYGMGSHLQMGVRAATAALQGLATGSVESAAVGAASPYLNKLIKAQTGDNKEANLIAHAVLGAVEAHVTGNNAVAGAVGALTAEAAAPEIMKALYNTDNPESLTDSQKRNVANLSQNCGRVGRRSYRR